MQMTRRFFLQTTGALAVYCGVAPFDLLASRAFAGELPKVHKSKTLVVVFLRGGIDGLSLVVPYKDPGYAPLRQKLLIPSPGQTDGAIDLDGFFGLHPRMKAIMPVMDAGRFVAAQAVGYGKNTRSHFQEQDTWETAIIGNTIASDGWLNRHLATSKGHGPVRAVALGNTLPRILRGKATAYAVEGLTDLNLPTMPGDEAQVTAALEHAYQCDPGKHAEDARYMVHRAGDVTLEGVRLIRKVARQPYKPAATYPNTHLGRELSVAARMIKADIGLEVVEIDYGGWDTHNHQSVGITGHYGNQVQTLGDALAAFAQDMGDKLEDTLVLTLSDFGRTARENGTGGTDHGWANVMLAMGGPVARTGEKAGVKDRRKVLTKWPGLLEDQLHQKRDLLDTTDFRDVLAEAVRIHLGNPHLQTVLPNHDFKPVGLIA